MKMLLCCEFKANGFALQNGTITNTNERGHNAEKLGSVHKADTVHDLPIFYEVTAFVV
jgi:hypothetical protein